MFSPGDEDSDWGFTQFMKLGELQNTAKGWVADDSICIEADIKLLNLDGGACLLTSPGAFISLSLLPPSSSLLSVSSFLFPLELLRF